MINLFLHILQGFKDSGVNNWVEDVGVNLWVCVWVDIHGGILLWGGVRDNDVLGFTVVGGISSRKVMEVRVLRILHATHIYHENYSPCAARSVENGVG